MRWNVGNGHKVRFWENKWLFSGTVLADVAASPVPVRLLSLPIAAFFTERGAWDTHMFQNLLPDHIFMEVLGSFISVVTDREDTHIWGATPIGDFYVRMTYEMLVVEDSGNRDMTIWNTI